MEFLREPSLRRTETTKMSRFYNNVAFLQFLGVAEEVGRFYESPILQLSGVDATGVGVAPNWFAMRDLQAI